MPEPSTLPVWNTDATNRTTPSGGLQAAGYATNAIPTSGNLNWYKNLVYQWVNWFKTVVTADGGVTAVANQDITVSGTGDYVHGDRTISVHPVSFSQYAAGGLTSGGGQIWFVSSGSGILYVGLPLKVGDRIKSVSVIHKGNSSADITAAAVNISHGVEPAGAAAIMDNESISSSGTSTNPGTSWTALVINCTDTVLLDGDVPVLKIDYNATGLAIGIIIVTYDHP